ncbi:checkpoint serine/threonineeeee-protein kinase [Sporothrix brasiliensis 5110]|uniref:Checkpoint serine/threonineeeee-protein kinase n=1 Tax=Sporothrix brasiliensis 5110 TaxID=1398154 RepID=A0A0C2FH03_9PEZI|nr:checkpoint serine/threonineeeee-protein kinase [Sporothrix brasiliensis 5110]KIH90373.1 checkpoint serine/threonineeeee-protein kinase [Sporothrix brasiliensis 5110]
MAASDELINFDVIESQKENIQSLPGGRSARKLAELYSPQSVGVQGDKLAPILTPTPNPGDTKTLHDTIRADFEAELAVAAESDDPLDAYDRYVRWTLDAYPSAQATPQSQLHLLLERATKAFVGAAQYRNDPRYLRLWLHYIHFFSDAPHETYVYLSRHNIGENLALFYEEYAAWLEGATRWAQADEVYRLGIERNARPQARLMRKYQEFEQRRATQAPESLNPDAPPSPALPTVRPVLAAKVDPFASAVAALNDPQAAQRLQEQQRQQQASSQAARGSKPKMAIFSDANASAAAPALGVSGASTKGWESIGSLAERKKENVVAAKPWAGETLSAGGKKPKSKMAVFKDAVTVNPASGKKERVFVDLRAVYPTPEEPGTELSFEEIWAANRGLQHRSWDEVAPAKEDQDLLFSPVGPRQMDVLADTVATKLVVHRDVVRLDENGAMIKNHDQNNRPRKKKVVEANVTQISDGEDDDEGDNEKADSADVDASAVDGDEAGNVSSWSDFAVRKDISGLQDTITADQTPSTTTAGDTDDVGNSSDRDEPDEEFSPLPIRGFSHPVGGDANDENAVPSLPSSPVRPAAQDKVVVPEPPRTRTVFIPIPPEDYVAPTRPYRDPAEVANNRLPFMTPITERTESSLEFDSEDNKRALHAKTPSKAMGRRSLHLSSPNEEDDDEDVEVDEEGEEEKTSSGIIPPEPLSSPLIDIVDDDDDLPQPPPLKLAQPVFQKVAVIPVVDSAAASRTVPAKGPIIKETQCNPVDEGIRAEILANIQPPLGSYSGFYDHRDEKCDKGAEIRRYAKAVSGKYKSGGSGVNGGSGSGSDRSSGAGVPVVIQFADCPSKYTVRREIGAGAFAPVYLVENMDPDGEKNANGGEQQAVAQMGRGAFASAHSRRYAHEALKMETPPTTWEFHMMRLAHTRLGPQHRATASLAPALECHLYRDETFLFLPFYPHGTLLDVVNLFRGESSGVMDETLAMFFAIELFRTVESLHSKNILHGDIKADNCLLRLEDPLCTPSLGSSTSSSSSNSRIADSSEQLSSQWQADGTGGWAARGMTLIDFGRAIDMRAFPADVKFVADWKTTAQDCAEMREGRPWTWQIDYHGLAGTLHCLLFGKYMETVRCDQGMSAAFPGDAALGAGGPGAALLERGPVKRYRIRETLKRYWQTDIWTEAFELLLNPAGFAATEEGGKMPVLRSMRHVRERMETWLAANCERGVGLKSLIIKVEHWARTRK